MPRHATVSVTVGGAFPQPNQRGQFKNRDLNPGFTFTVSRSRPDPVLLASPSLPSTIVRMSLRKAHIKYEFIIFFFF
jgi:hypothetical protein